MDHLDDVLADDFAKLGWRAATPARRPSDPGSDDQEATVGSANPGSPAVEAAEPVGATVGTAPAARPNLRTVPFDERAAPVEPARPAPATPTAPAREPAPTATAPTRAPALPTLDGSAEALGQVAARLGALESRVTEVGAAVVDIGRVLNELQAQTRALRQANVEAGAKAILDAERTTTESDVRIRVHAIEQVMARTNLDRSAMGDRLEQLERQLAQIIRLLGG